MTDDMMEQDQNGAATKSDLLSVRSELLEGQRKMMMVLSQVVGTLAEVKENCATKAEARELRSVVLTRMDGFAGSLNDFRRQWSYQSDGLMLHQARLDDHDRRLGKIESRPQ